MLRFPCPRCKAVLRIAERQAGRKTICPGCAHSLNIPLPEAVRGALQVWATISEGTEPEAPAGEQRPFRGRQGTPWWKSRWVAAYAALAVFVLLLVPATFLRSGPPKESSHREETSRSGGGDEVVLISSPSPKPSADKLGGALPEPPRPREEPAPAATASSIPELPRPAEKRKEREEPAKTVPAPPPDRADIKEPTPEMFKKAPVDLTRYLRVEFDRKHRFGISWVDRGEARQDNRAIYRRHRNPFGDGSADDGGRPGKQLTFAEDGATNNTCLRIDGRPVLFPGPVAVPVPYQERKEPGWKSTRVYPAQGIEVTQDVRICRGEQSLKLDTCLVRYTLGNKDTRPHQVGIRFMLDTYIGSNDGVPFTIPTRAGLCNTCYRARTTAIPDYLQVLERPDLRRTGTVAHLGLRLPETGAALDSPSELLLTHWPGSDAGWTIQVRPIRHDSAVVIYWADKLLRPGESRRVGFTYGLGAVASGEGGGSLALTVGGVFRVGRQFTVVAYVNKPKQGQTATLKLPPGLRLIAPAAARQGVPASMLHPIAQVSWRVEAEKEGAFQIATALNNGASQTKEVVIYPAATGLP